MLPFGQLMNHKKNTKFGVVPQLHLPTSPFGIISTDRLSCRSSPWLFLFWANDYSRFFLLHIGKNCGVSLIIYRVALYIPADDWHASILCPSLPADTGKTSNLSCLFALFTSLYPGILMISLPTMDYMEILHDFLVSIVIFTVSLCACLFHFFQKPTTSHKFGVQHNHSWVLKWPRSVYRRRPQMRLCISPKTDGAPVAAKVAPRKKNLLGCPKKLGSMVIGSVGDFTPRNTPFIRRLQATFTKPFTNYYELSATSKYQT